MHYDLDRNFSPDKSTEYFTTLWEKVKNEYATTKVFPPKNQIFRALELTAFDDVEVVIIGRILIITIIRRMDCVSLFLSRLQHHAIPEKYFFIELKDDLGVVRTSKELDDWGRQGVLLLNATLTVRAHSPNSHKRFRLGKIYQLYY